MVTEQETSPIIVYGPPRSGTTYLIQVLNRHPEISISNETRLFVWAHRSLNVVTQEWHSLFNKREDFVDYLRGAYPKLIRDFYKKLHPRARYWGDKNPYYAAKVNEGCLDTIVDLFPETRFIHIVRDGRDVVSSLMRRGWGNFEASHYIWAEQVDIGSAFGKSLPANQYFEVRYEDLVQDDVGIARKLFDFLGIEMHPNVVSFCREQQRNRSPINQPTRDLNDGAAGSDWERLLAPDQQLRSLELLGERLVRYGYETEASLAKAKRELAELSGKSSISPIREVVSSALPSDVTVLIASEGENILPNLDARQIGWHFPRAKDGRYASQPADSEEAIAHLEESRAEGASFLLFPNTAYGWLDRFEDFRRHLDSRYRRIWDDERCIIYKLSSS
jgi:hypothetical protein